MSALSGGRVSYNVPQEHKRGDLVLTTNSFSRDKKWYGIVLNCRAYMGTQYRLYDLLVLSLNNRNVKVLVRNTEIEKASKKGNNSV